MKKLLPLLVLLPSLVFAQAFPSTPILDDFSGDLSSWTDGVTGTGTCTISGGGVTGGSGTDDCYWTATFGAAQEVYATISALGDEDNNKFLSACLQGGLGTANVDGYVVRVRRRSGQDDAIQMARLTDAGTTNIGTQYTGMGELAASDAVGMRIEAGGTLTLYFNDGGGGWSQVDQVTGETTYTCAGTNIGLEANNTSHIWDNFGGGTIPENAFMMILEAK